MDKIEKAFLWVWCVVALVAMLLFYLGDISDAKCRLCSELYGSDYTVYKGKDFCGVNGTYVEIPMFCDFQGVRLKCRIVTYQTIDGGG